MVQNILSADNNYQELDNWVLEHRLKTILLVCGHSIRKQPIHPYFEELPKRLETKVVRFTDFTPNPDYESVVKGVEVFRKEHCDGIAAVGGGSAMDVAKCIKLFCNMNPEISFLQQTIVPNRIPFLAVPTTAGTGSEATRFAVIYKSGVKQSISDVSCIPESVLLDSAMLSTLPPYQRKSTMMDALSHAIESFWSMNSTEESKAYSREAIRQVLENKDGYLANTALGNKNMLLAANIAGKAINLTQTTAGHAMSYKITGIFGCAHGHAVALCNRVLYPWLIQNSSGCIDPRGEAYLKNVLDEIGKAMGGSNARDGADIMMDLFHALAFEIPEATPEQFAELKSSVNPERLKNFPVCLDESAIDQLYHSILRERR